MSATVLTFPPQRTLTQVLAELMLAMGEQKRLYAMPDSQWTEHTERRSADLDDTIWLRKDEARAMIEAATGVSWDSIQEALA